MRLLGLATIVLALAAACGGNGDAGPTKAAYERQLQALPDLFAGDDCAVPDPVEALEARQTAFAERVEALEAVEPPSEVAEAHAQFVSAHRARADALAEAMPEVRALGDPHEAKTRDEQAQLIADGFALAEQAEPEPTALGAAVRAFGEAGYTLEPPALEPDAYEERTNEVVAEISPIAIADAATTGELQAEAERLGLELLDRARELEEIVPPPPVAEAHEHLVLGVCARAQELVLFGRFGGVEPNEPADTTGLRAVIATLDPFFEEAAGDYRDRGYDVAVPEVETG